MKPMKLLSTAMAIAAGLPLAPLGRFSHEKPLRKIKRGNTQADHDAISAAQAKRERKAAKLRGKGL